ncbi:hypothetical protein SAOR_01155 [Salinisphaera orenii MK-B5]|uniref:Lysylphosphatidylglycerol synthetase n=1 Tax=Salinisphaera orenii MK-B5 TaxID=856730 RepID=A0A423PXW5_9GAMM|nr:hypothetical protein SAOR_01155 [Salinisphaera orenii MK-B5]
MLPRGAPRPARHAAAGRAVTPRRAALLRLSVTVILLGLVAWRLDTAEIAAQLGTIAPGWALAALALTVPQVVVSAWRWRLTAHGIGLDLRLPVAVREYYLATFLNQILPGGVLGDATRAWRHARHNDNRGAVHAVLIERLSGQLAMLLIAALAVLQARGLRQGVARAFEQIDPWAATGGFILLAGGGLLTAFLVRGSRRMAIHLLSLIDSLGRGLLGRRMVALQLASSLLVAASYVGVFVLCAQALGLDRGAQSLWMLAPPVLLAMAIPLSVAGWGLREGAAAVIWSLAGLPAQEGVAISITYGLIVLVSSLPGLVVLARGGRRRAAAHA